MEYKAVVYWSFGWGLEVTTIAAASYKELQTEVSKFVNKVQYSTFKMLGITSNGHIEKVVYKYPSGKTFTERY